MSGNATSLTRWILGAAVLLALGLSGCSLVKRQELDAQLAGMRAEMEAERRAEIAEGDRRVSDDLNGRMDALSSRVDGLEEALTALAEDFDAQVQELVDVVRFDAPIYFGFDEDEVVPEYAVYLDRFAQIVNRYYPGSRVTVEGFTDAVGTVDYNLALGQRRADAVREYLVQRGGLSPDYIKAVSYGEAADRLVAVGAHGPGSAGWENRRVSLVIDHTGT